MRHSHADQSFPAWHRWRRSCLRVSLTSQGRNEATLPDFFLHGFHFGKIDRFLLVTM